MQHAANEVEAHAVRRFGASIAARRRSGAACDRALVAHRQLVGRRFRRTHRRAVWRRRGASSNPITTGFGKSSRNNSNCFPTSFAIKERHARGIAARPIEARDHAELDRIGGGNEDDRNRLRCRQSRLQLIEEGSRADVFLSADTHWMDYGIQKKVIKDDSCFLLLGNTHRRIPNLEMSRSSRVSTWLNSRVMASSR